MSAYKPPSSGVARSARGWPPAGVGLRRGSASGGVRPPAGVGLRRGWPPAGLASGGVRPPAGFGLRRVPFLLVQKRYQKTRLGGRDSISLPLRTPSFKRLRGIAIPLRTPGVAVPLPLRKRWLCPLRSRRGCRPQTVGVVFLLHGEAEGQF